MLNKTADPWIPCPEIWCVANFQKPESDDGASLLKIMQWFSLASGKTTNATVWLQNSVLPIFSVLLPWHSPSPYSQPKLLRHQSVSNALDFTAAAPCTQNVPILSLTKHKIHSHISQHSAVLCFSQWSAVDVAIFPTTIPSHTTWGCPVYYKFFLPKPW